MEISSNTHKDNKERGGGEGVVVVKERFPKLIGAEKEESFLSATFCVIGMRSRDPREKLDVAYYPTEDVSLSPLRWIPILFPSDGSLSLALSCSVE